MFCFFFFSAQRPGSEGLCCLLFFAAAPRPGGEGKISLEVKNCSLFGRTLATFIHSQIPEHRALFKGGGTDGEVFLFMWDSGDGNTLHGPLRLEQLKMSFGSYILSDPPMHELSLTSKMPR